MIAVALGGGALLLLLTLLWGFAHAPVARVKQAAVWGLGAIGAVLLAVLLLSGRGASAFWALFMFGPALGQALRGWWARRRFARPQAQPGEASGVETALLRMRMDMATGAMSGEVTGGRFAGRPLAGMALAELRELLAEARREDADSVPLLEAWLDRAHPDWREEAAPEAPPPRGGAMTADEALAVLGLAEGATEAEIRAAHRRLMQAAHPDRGGSDWLAARVNQARDALLG